jgi:hypothetical protein
MDVSDKKMLGSVAVLLLQEEFAALAKRMKPRHFDMQENLAQEMSVSLLECEKPHTLNYFRNRARSRAKNFLRNWFRQSPVARAEYKDRLRRRDRPEVFHEAAENPFERLRKVSVNDDMNVPNPEALIQNLKRPA